ncbi:7759_t:CDS:2 [Cetraspora pellucida]|uniref:7759_t:CDS:1 n=1 Tax=Cetraspora pellucida TaxID=1433469 RepID=A0A9N9F6Z0_9GLOM|nr:7759_t:CDS:2 [Cetraspora pellucida]
MLDVDAIKNNNLFKIDQQQNRDLKNKEKYEIVSRLSNAITCRRYQYAYEHQSIGNLKKTAILEEQKQSSYQKNDSSFNILTVYNLVFKKQKEALQVKHIKSSFESTKSHFNSNSSLKKKTTDTCLCFHCKQLNDYTKTCIIAL